MNDRVFKHTHAHKLEDPERLKWLPPAEVLSRLHLKPGTRVADVGAGTGYFSLPIAQAIGDAGTVFAVDMQQEMLDLLRRKLRAAERAEQHFPSSGPGSQAAVSMTTPSIVAFYANIWHELDDHDAVLREAMRVTAPKGSIAILDWRSDKESPPGPPQEHRISAETVVTFLQTN